MFKDWSATIAPMLVFTEFRDMVSYLADPKRFTFLTFCERGLILSALG
jgi:hypothetical protein